MARSDYAAARAAWEALGRAINAAERAPDGDWRHSVVAVALDAVSEAISPPDTITPSDAIASERANKEQGT